MGDVAVEKLTWYGIGLVCMLLLFSAIRNTSASSPVEIPFQASGFRDGTGTLIPNANVTMYIFNSSSGGLPIYNETFLNGMTNGYISVTMGENLSRTLNLTWGHDYWLALNISGVGVQMINGSNQLTWRKHFVATQGRIEGLDTLNATIQNLMTSNTSIYTTLGQVSQNFTSLSTSNTSLWTTLGLVSKNFTSLGTSNSSIWSAIGATFLNMTDLQTSNDSTNLRITQLNQSVLNLVGGTYNNVSNLQTSNTSIWTTLGLVSQNFTSLGTSNTSIWTRLGLVSINFTALTTSNSSIWAQLGLISSNFTAFTASNSSIWTTLGLIDRNFTSLGNSTLVRAGYGVCGAGQVMQNVSVNASGITANCTTDATGSGSASWGTMTISDLYSGEFSFNSFDFETYLTGYTNIWIPTGLASGTLLQDVATTEHIGVVNLTSSTSATSGYSIETQSSVAYLLDTNYTTTFIFKPMTKTWNFTFARLGWLDSTSSTLPVDGVYFNVTQINTTHSLIRAEAVTNNVLLVNATTNYTVLNSTWLKGTIFINATNLATYIIWNASGEQWRATLSTIPTAVGRNTGHGVVAWHNGTLTAAQNLLTLDYISVGVNRRLVR